MPSRVGFVLLGKQQRRIIRWRPVSVLRIKGIFLNYSLINTNTHQPTKPDYVEWPKHDVKFIIGDAWRERTGRKGRILSPSHWKGQPSRNYQWQLSEDSQLGPSQRNGYLWHLFCTQEYSKTHLETSKWRYVFPKRSCFGKRSAFLRCRWLLGLSEVQILTLTTIWWYVRFAQSRPASPVLCVRNACNRELTKKGVFFISLVSAINQIKSATAKQNRDKQK